MERKAIGEKEKIGQATTSVKTTIQDICATLPQTFAGLSNSALIVTLMELGV